MPKLQLALDVVDIEKGLALAEQVKDSVDIIEAGTPFIKACGLEAVRRLRAAFPNHLIEADMKTADTGDFEFRLAADAGADFVTVMAATPIETVRAMTNEARAYERETGRKANVVVDLIGVRDLEARVREVSAEAPDYILIHCGIDEQKQGKDPIASVRRVAGLTTIPLVAAGGVDAAKAKLLAAIPQVAVIVVGGKITGAADPTAAAREIRAAITNVS